MVKVKIDRSVFNGLYNMCVAKFVLTETGGHTVVYLIHPN